MIPRKLLVSGYVGVGCRCDLGELRVVGSPAGQVVLWEDGKRGPGRSGFFDILRGGLKVGFWIERLCGWDCYQTILSISRM